MGAAAAVAGAAVGSAVIGGYSANKAAGKAAAAQQAGIAAEERMHEKDLAFQEKTFEYTKEQLAPWQEAGLEGLSVYKQAVNDGFDFEADPGYQFRLEEGQRGIEAASSSRGRSLSSATLRNLTRYNSGLASQEYAAAHGRYQDRLTRLKSLADFGFSASTGLATAAGQYGSNVSNSFQNMGQNLSQFHQNMGAIGAQQAMAPYNSMMAGANTAVGAYGMYKMFNA